ncbi:MAG: PAS domain-containing protein [Frankia sp.]|nr:PAS domain-containing protein [Frankia sp.]
MIPPGAIPANDFPGGFDPGRLLDTLSEVVFRTDAEGRWTYLNPAWTRLTGFDVATSLGTRFIDYVHPDEVEHTIALFMAVVVGGADHCHHETRYRTSDGSYRRVQIRAQVLRDDAGEVVGNVGTIVDVTAARFGAESAGELGALLELVPSGGRLDDLPVGVLVYDSDLVLVRPSRVVERLVGVRVEAGQHLDELADRLRPGIAGGQRLGGEWGLVATAQRTGQAQIGDLDVWRAPAHDASARHALAGALVEGQAQAGGTAEAAGPVRTLRATVIPPSPGGDGQLAIVLSDITDLRRAERQQAALAYLGQRALSTLDVPALLTEAVELVASTLGVERCDLGECIQITTGGGRARRVVFDPAHASTAAAVGGSAPSPSPAF